MSDQSDRKTREYNEPWVDEGDGEIGAGSGDPLPLIAEGNLNSIFWRSCEHQVRALACVNALAGYSQDELERMPVGGMTALINELGEAQERLRNALYRIDILEHLLETSS